MERYPVRLVQWDEFGFLLKNLASPRVGSHETNLKTMLLELYGVGNGVQEKKALGQDEADKEVQSPFLTLYCTTTEDIFFDNISKYSVNDGFLNRFLVWRSGVARPKLNTDHYKFRKVPENTLKFFRSWDELDPISRELVGGVYHGVPEPKEVPLTDQAKSSQMELEAHIDARHAALKKAGGPAGLWARAGEQVLRLAAIIAAGRLPPRS